MGCAEQPGATWHAPPHVAGLMAWQWHVPVHHTVVCSSLTGVYIVDYVQSHAAAQRQTHSHTNTSRQCNRHIQTDTGANPPKDPPGLWRIDLVNSQSPSQLTRHQVDINAVVLRPTAAMRRARLSSSATGCCALHQLLREPKRSCCWVWRCCTPAGRACCCLAACCCSRQRRLQRAWWLWVVQL